MQLWSVCLFNVTKIHSSFYDSSVTVEHEVLHIYDMYDDKKVLWNYTPCDVIISTFIESQDPSLGIINFLELPQATEMNYEV